MTDAKTHTNHNALLSEETKQLQLLRQHRRMHRQRKPLVVRPFPPADSGELPAMTRGQRLADFVAATIGSWRFIIIQSSVIAVWITGNVLAGESAWDPYPFILLNLLLSFQAAYTAPAIMMSQNRQSELDRRHAQSDYEINVKAELEIELLHEKIDILKEQELLALTQAGLERDASYRLVQRNAMKVWEAGADFKTELLADPEVTAALSTAEIEEKFDLGYHTKHVDTIFDRVFGVQA